MSVTHQILFIQGGGAGAYKADQQLVVSLRRTQGTAYELLYPKMPHECEPDYRIWKAQIGKKLGRLKNGAILVGHSLGASFLLKYLSDEKVEKAIAGIFLIATPYWGGDGWRYEGYESVALPTDFPSKLPSSSPIFFYHSRDDQIVPFAHLTLYEKIATGDYSRSRCAWASVKKRLVWKLPRISRICNEPTRFVQLVSFKDLS